MNLLATWITSYSKTKEIINLDRRSIVSIDTRVHSWFYSTLLILIKRRFVDLKLIDLNLSGNLLHLKDDNKESCQLKCGHKQIDRSLNVDTFHSLTNLQTLKLDHNQLTRIEFSRRHLVVSLARAFFIWTTTCCSHSIDRLSFLGVNQFRIVVCLLGK